MTGNTVCFVVQLSEIQTVLAQRFQYQNRLSSPQSSLRKNLLSQENKARSVLPPSYPQTALVGCRSQVGGPPRMV